MRSRFLFEREYVGYAGALTHIARGIERLAGEPTVGAWIGADGVWSDFVEQVLRPIEKLERDPSRLVILGDGRQNKQYVYSQDLVQGICDFMSRGYEGYNIFNISTESFTDVNTIADIVCRGMGLDDVKYEYTGGSCGWKGDVPSFDYDISKAKSEGWSFRYNSTQAVEATVTAVLSTR